MGNSTERLTIKVSWRLDLLHYICSSVPYRLWPSDTMLLSLNSRLHLLHESWLSLACLAPRDSSLNVHGRTAFLMLLPKLDLTVPLKVCVTDLETGEDPEVPYIRLKMR